jgi:GNAT superfamily N-acetyltransferase
MLTGCFVRPARADEAGFLSALALRSKAYWGYSSDFVEACRKELTYSAHDVRSNEKRFFVLEDSSGAVGFYAIEWLSRIDMQLEALFVDSHCIGRRYGRILIEHAKREAASLGAQRMLLQGDPHAARFYVAADGVRTGESESVSFPGRFLPTFAIDLVRTVAT